MKSIISVKVIPNAKKDGVVERMADGTVKIRLRAKAVEGKANEALIKYLSEVLTINRESLSIVAGKTARRKKVAVEGLSSDQITGTLFFDQVDP